MALCMLLILRIVEFVCDLRRAVFREVAIKTMYAPTCIAATGDNHVLITSYNFDNVMVYTLGDQLVHEFGGYSSNPGRCCAPYGICVDVLLYVLMTVEQCM